MAKKQVIRLTESDLHRIIKESVKNVLTEKDERLKWEELFNLWSEWNDLGAYCRLNKDDKMIVKNKVENNPQLMNYLNSGEYGKIIKSLDDVISRIGSVGKHFKDMDDYWRQCREYEIDTLF
jgi:hypothetical protein